MFILGYWTGRSPKTGAPENMAPSEKSAVYTCSMHPQIRLDRPGKCPICEMPLIPAGSAPAAGTAPSLELSEHALAMASIETVAVERRHLSREVRAVGLVQYNESSLATITPRVDGYAERLFVNFTGIEIRAGDHLAEIYSPELLVAQSEMLIAVEAGGALVDVARKKLRLLNMTEEQISRLVEKKETTDRVTLYSPISGTVIEKGIIEKSAFKAGDPLYRIANLDSVWVYLDIYEFDLPWVRYGQSVKLTAEAVPGRSIEGLVTFIQPMVNEGTRTVRVPVHVGNLDHALKPGMFVTATIAASLTADGRAAPTGVEGRFSCPMHPQVFADTPGECPNCHMPLERIPGERTEAMAHGHEQHAAQKYICPMKCEGEKTYPEPGNCPVCGMKLKAVPVSSASTTLAVPVSAVLDSGTRRIVYVEKSRGAFEPREIEVGPRAGEFYSVLSGIAEGERVVTRGGFLLDSQFQITGHSSLFYPGGLHPSTGHEKDGQQQERAEPAHKH